MVPPIPGAVSPPLRARVTQPAPRGAGERLQRWAEHPAGPALLALSAVAEAALFPAPTEALLVALGVGRRGRSAGLAVLATLAAAAGAALGYHIGAEWLGSLGAAGSQLARVRELYRDNLFLALVTSGFTPIPFVVYTTAAGAVGVPFGPFLLGAVTGRGLKYLLLAVLAHGVGARLRQLRDSRRARLALAAALLALLGLWLARL